ncbi:putative ABC transport system permease protein [Parabacteroides sp. PF5-5]|uniref:ABC transporter permease n=1 Tax=unclassified Parabacteroides TaxID=2649774 RepID=UPI002474EE91|nr:MULTISPECIES: ABC transporter permease [unclassified Parabacteroides]MDH6304546.1 putative ABC transport system permease protein [Parabacteroides sp. PH5-39]MDH6315302.1 putative ABC transport system permease protein [Parabacteroides sp. PF5-13]MDH6319204.1 putative ABC transport system permease protein [Parabacteroides sp. PH5-13]MDH6322935.1 putative ABC transport system permease protein [Parabacteroides sp. PH5-8]MDH6326493.1 putative ABC transport system permease protein [Parabacteroide
MKTILRNFLSVLRRFKMATVLNILGLAVAFAAFSVILIQVHYERSFDTCHPTAERVFRVELQDPGVFSIILPRAFVERVITSSPHIEAGTLIYPYNGKIHYSVMIDGEKHGFRETTMITHADITKVFDFQMVEGNPDCLNDPDKVIIPESLARALFGTSSAVGQLLHAEENVQTKDEKTFTIGAVYRDFPGNTQLSNAVYTTIGDDAFKGNFGASNFMCYLLLDSPSSAQAVADNFNETFDFKQIGREDYIHLVPLTDIYYAGGHSDARLTRTGNPEISKLLFLIAVLIIIIAIINYVNFSTSLTPMRIKSINTQKVLGSTDTQLRRALVAESVIVALVAWFLSLLIVWMLNKTSVLPFVEANLGFVVNLPILLLTGAIAILAGFVAGLYPARYMVSFPPALVLKGSFGLSPSGRKLRTALIGIQFIVSIVLIVSASLVKLQNDYMRDFSLGFDKDQIMLVDLTTDIYQKHHETFVNQLKEYPGIEDVAFAMERVASQDSYNTNTIRIKEQTLQFYMIICSSNFLDVMGIPVEEGRDFTPADQKQTDGRAFIYNWAAKLQANLEVGDALDQSGRSHIVGFTGDVKFTSLRNSSDNVGFVVWEHPYPMSNSYIRIKKGTDIEGAIRHIRSTLAAIDPSFPVEVEFYDAVFNQLYHKETNLRSLITLFSLLAIILSLVGVFGLVVFDTQYRRKEIAIRKVHGSTITQILELLNRQYVYIIMVCFVIAAPLAWYTISKWLENFAYKTPIHWWIYAFSFCIILLITLATVTFQSWRVANANPVDSLKTE